MYQIKWFLKVGKRICIFCSHWHEDCTFSCPREREVLFLVVDTDTTIHHSFSKGHKNSFCYLKEHQSDFSCLNRTHFFFAVYRDTDIHALFYFGHEPESSFWCSKCTAITACHLEGTKTKIVTVGQNTFVVTPIGKKPRFLLESVQKFISIFVVRMEMKIRVWRSYGIQRFFAVDRGTELTYSYHGYNTEINSIFSKWTQKS